MVIMGVIIGFFVSMLISIISIGILIPALLSLINNVNQEQRNYKD